MHYFKLYIQQFGLGWGTTVENVLGFYEENYMGKFDHLAKVYFNVNNTKYLISFNLCANNLFYFRFLYQSMT